MADEYVFKMVGMKPLQRNMLRRYGNLKNGLRRANVQALAIIDRWVQKNFQGEGKLAMGGGGWEPLSDRTLIARERGYGEYKKSKRPLILQNIGNLRNRWKHYATDRTAYTMAAMPYGIYHQEGSGNLPERRIIPKNEQIAPQLRKHYEWFIGQAIR